MTSFTYLLSVAIIGLQFADFYTTLVILRNGGRELNPLIGKLIDWLGLAPGLLIAKSLAILVIATGSYRGWFESAPGMVMLALLVILYLAAVVNNYFEMRKIA